MKVTEYHRLRSVGVEDRMRFEEVVLASVRIPSGTVTSSLSRAHGQLQLALAKDTAKEAIDEL